MEYPRCDTSKSEPLDQEALDRANAEAISAAMAVGRVGLGVLAALVSGLFWYFSRQ